jgi:hypothetical protein
LLDNFCNGECLIATLDPARPGNNSQLAVAYRRVIDANHSFIRSKVERY